MDLEGEVSQTEKDEYCMLSLRLESKIQSKHECSKIETDLLIQRARLFVINYILNNNTSPGVYLVLVPV